MNIYLLQDEINQILVTNVWMIMVNKLDKYKRRENHV